MEKNKLINKIYFVLTFFLFESCDYKPKIYLLENFNSSPVYKLIKAIDKEDIKKIRYEVIENKIDVNFQDNESWNV